MTIGGITSIGAGNKNLVIAVSITAYSGSKTGKGRKYHILRQIDTRSSSYMHNIKSIQGRQLYVHNIKVDTGSSILQNQALHITLFAAMTDVPITFPSSSTTSIPSLSSWCRISTELRVLAVANQ